jgi:hypothetical protein
VTEIGDGVPFRKILVWLGNDGADDLHRGEATRAVGVFGQLAGDAQPFTQAIRAEAGNISFEWYRCPEDPDA